MCVMCDLELVLNNIEGFKTNTEQLPTSVSELPLEIYFVELL